MKLTVARPVFGQTASFLVNEAAKHEEKILIKKDHWIIDGKSLLGLLALALQPGDEVELEFEGTEVDPSFVEALKKEGLLQ